MYQYEVGGNSRKVREFSGNVVINLWGILEGKFSIGEMNSTGQLGGGRIRATGLGAGVCVGFKL